MKRLNAFLGSKHKELRQAVKLKGKKKNPTIEIYETIPFEKRLCDTQLPNSLVFNPWHKMECSQIPAKVFRVQG
jgi:hypothetical protein